MASYNYTFTSGDTVTPTKLNSARTVSEIVNADIKSDAAIALSKLATGALPAAITVASDNLVDGTIVNADINASAAIAGTKVDPNFGSQNVTTTGVGTFSILDIRRGDPRVQINETDASTNNKQWDILADNEGMFIRAVNDAYNAAGNAIEIQRSGTTIDSVSMPNGNVNIGTSSSTSKLTVVDNSANDAVRITQTGSGNALVVEDSANPDATPFVVTADGSVGIGTVPLPGVKLEVVGGIRSALLNIIDGAAATYRFLALNTNNVARWHVGTDNDAESGSNAGSNFFMHRWSDNGTFLERVLHISRSTGNIGINTSTPTERLDVNGTVKAAGFSADGIQIEGLSGRNYFRDSEAVGELRVGAAWGLPGIYAESGRCVVGGQAGVTIEPIGAGNVGIGTSTPNSKAMLDITSTTQGFLPPRMTTTQRDAITSPPAGLMVYNSTTNKLNFYNGTAWEAVTSA
jgi:hypothetical protein